MIFKIKIIHKNNNNISILNQERIDIKSNSLPVHRILAEFSDF